METNSKKKTDQSKEDEALNSQLEGNDKAPGEELGTKEKVTNRDLKGKKVDADPTKEEGKPAE